MYVPHTSQSLSLTLSPNGSQLLQVRSLSHLLKEPKFPAEFMPEYICLLERFEVVLSQTSQTLLIPSRLPRKKPSSIILPPASPGCELTSLLLLFAYYVLGIIYLSISFSPSSPDSPSLPVHLHTTWLLATTGGQAHRIPKENSPSLHQGGLIIHISMPPGLVALLCVL